MRASACWSADGLLLLARMSGDGMARAELHTCTSVQLENHPGSAAPLVGYEGTAFTIQLPLIENGRPSPLPGVRRGRCRPALG